MRRASLGCLLLKRFNRCVPVLQGQGEQAVRQGISPAASFSKNHSISGLCALSLFATCPSVAGRAGHFVTCGRGGIGRRAALRSLWGNPWKFESSRPHQHPLRRSDFRRCDDAAVGGLVVYSAGFMLAGMDALSLLNMTAANIRTLARSSSEPKAVTGSSAP